MGRDEEGLRREVAASDSSTDTSDGSGDEQTYVVREDAVRSLDADVELRRISSDEEELATRIQGDPVAAAIDPRVDGPGALPESADVSTVGPDGTSIGGGGFTSPTGDALGGGSLSDDIRAGGTRLGGDALGGSRLDPLGMLDSSDVGSPTDREIEQAISRADGSFISAAPIDPATGMQTGRDRDLDPPEPPTNRYEDPSYDGEHDHAPPMTGRDQDPTDDEQGDDIVGPGYAQPDPNAGYDTVTGANVEVALRTQGTAPYAQPTQDDDSSGAMTSVNLDWAAPGSDPRVTQYGPDGPQTVEGATWTPERDLIFDPPPDGASAGMAGAAAMADPGAALGGPSTFGSSTPDDAPPPPDPPPGDDTDQGPLGPPGGGGGEG